MPFVRICPYNGAQKQRHAYIMQIPIKELPAGETEDRWLELGKAESHQPDNPLGASVRVRTSPPALSIFA